MVWPPILYLSIFIVIAPYQPYPSIVYPLMGKITKRPLTKKAKYVDWVTVETSRGLRDKQVSMTPSPSPRTPRKSSSSLSKVGRNVVSPSILRRPSHNSSHLNGHTAFLTIDQDTLPVYDASTHSFPDAQEPADGIPWVPDEFLQESQTRRRKVSYIYECHAC